MKKGVIICLLSLSLCLSQAAPPADENATKTKDTKTEDKEITIVTTPHPSIETSPKKQTDIAPVHTEPKITDKPEQKNTEKQTEKPDANKTDKNNEVSTPKASEANKINETTPKPPPKPETKTTDSGNVTTTPAPVTIKPTEATKVVTEKPLLAARGFDGMSFVGGIVLTLGLLAIGFMGFKYYKNQTERNYHTL